MNKKWNQALVIQVQFTARVLHHNFVKLQSALYGTETNTQTLTARINVMSFQPCHRWGFNMSPNGESFSSTDFLFYFENFKPLCRLYYSLCVSQKLGCGCVGWDLWFLYTSIFFFIIAPTVGELLFLKLESVFVV